MESREGCEGCGQAWRLEKGPHGPPGQARFNHAGAAPRWGVGKCPPTPALLAASGNSLPRAFLAVSLSSLVSSVLRKRQTLSLLLFPGPSSTPGPSALRQAFLGWIS